MYILIISRGYPSEKYKMNGIFEFDQAKALVKAGQKVVYAAIDVRSIRHTRRWGFESFEKFGVQIEAINIPCGRIPKTILNKIRIIALKILYKRIKLRYGVPDVIHAHFIGVGYITVKAFGKSNIPLVLTEHFSEMNRTNLNSNLLKLGKYTYTRMDQVLAVGNTLTDNIKEKFGVQAITIPNIVDTSSFKYREKKNSDIFSFVSIGSLISRKGMDLLIQAFSKAFYLDRDVKLFIYGEGRERRRLEKMIESFGLEEQVFLMGLVDRKEIASKMSKSDCFVLASRRETFGVAYIEAMAVGLPVIATKCGGPENFVMKQNGVLIPTDDINALIKALREVYKSISSYDGKVISNYTKERFGPDSIAKQLIDVYNTLNKAKFRDKKYD